MKEQDTGHLHNPEYFLSVSLKTGVIFIKEIKSGDFIIIDEGTVGFSKLKHLFKLKSYFRANGNK
jgi:hypothetical protein